MITMRQAKRVFLLMFVATMLYLTWPVSALRANVLGLVLLHEQTIDPINQQCQPDTTESICWLSAEAARLRQDTDAARDGYEHLVQKNQRRPLALYRLGQLYWQQGNEQRAIVLWQDSTVREAFITACTNIYAFDSQATQRKIEACDLATLVAPQSRLAWFQLGIAYEQSSEFEMAAQAYLRAASIPESASDSTSQAQFPELEVRLGGTLRKLGKVQEAYYWLNKADEQSTKWWVSNFNLGLVLLDDRLVGVAEAKKQALYHLQQAFVLAPQPTAFMKYTLGRAFLANDLGGCGRLFMGYALEDAKAVRDEWVAANASRELLKFKGICVMNPAEAEVVCKNVTITEPECLVHD